MEQQEHQRNQGSGLPIFLGRALIGLLSMLFLGFGLGLSVHKGASFLWVLGMLGTLSVVVVLLARWQVRPWAEPLEQLLGGHHQRTLEDLPQAWSELQRENRDLKERAGREDRMLPGIMARLEEGVLLFGTDRGLEQFNPAAQRHLGLGAPLAKAMTAQEIFPDRDGQDAIQKAFGGLSCEWRFTRASRTLRVRAIPFAPLGAVSGVLLTLDDITSQEALETTRQKFISNVSHELKTPATAIRIAAENLQEEELSPGARTMAQSMLRSVDRLTLLLGDLSELSRIESGALRLAPETLDLASYVDTLAKDLASRYADSGVHLMVGLDAPDGASILVDPLRLHQVIENLVSNAVKFSPDGGTVRLAVSLGPHGHAWSVQDQGPGIPEADQGRIFERFYRTQGAKVKPGSGLGLAIVKHLCRLMGGEVTVESRAGEGATFRVMLPGTQASAGPPSR